MFDLLKGAGSDHSRTQEEMVGGGVSVPPRVAGKEAGVSDQLIAAGVFPQSLPRRVEARVSDPPRGAGSDRSQLK